MINTTNKPFQYINLTPKFNSLEFIELEKELKQLSNELGFRS